jgi:23S rRNA (pseudouridine1915-N3)-methyltransferase
MELKILAVGRLKAGPETELCERYAGRITKAERVLGLQGVDIREIPESRASHAQERKTGEAAALNAALPAGFQAICLHEGGDLVDSAGLAKLIRRAADQSVPGLVYLIGGPDGLDAGLLDRCDRKISFGRATWPHQLVRVMLLEQLYRATTILSGHPYHRA